ncbi:MAG: FIST C-terminal domain-containing protein [Candidatus Omnitrophica bacterium]|nr:FIST C-terminal domain-containing protein [Candidatus Omnitrophota bacterium]
MSQALTMSIGWSVRADALRAGKEAASSAMERVGAAPKLALAFSSIHLHQESLLEGIHSVIGKTPLLGGSSAGVILPTGPVSHGCVVILLACSTLSCSVGAGEGVKDRQRECGQQAAFGALRDFPGNQRSCFLMFADGLAPGYSDVVRGICEVLGTSFLVVGGMAGDDMRFSKTYQYCKQRVLHNAVVGALLGGPICIGIGNAHGFAPISKPHRVTKAAGPIVYELDGQPAATVYEDYLGHESIAHMQKQGLSRQGIAYPLGWQADSSSPLLLRNVIGFGEGGSLCCTADVSEGSTLQLMIGNRELVLEAAAKAAKQAMQSVNRLSGILVFDAAVRKRLLGPQQAAQEIAMIQSVIGQSVPLAGCYTYGEQVPLQTASGYETANQTGSILIIALGT